MAEHAERYGRFAKFLNENGYIVYADDHRGHGKTAGTVQALGYLGDDGYNHIVEDEHDITEFIKENHPGLPVFVFAHSFGSFIGQSYITKFGKDIAGIVLSGSAAMSTPEIKLGKLLSGLQRLLFNEKKKSKLINNLSFASSNKRIENPKSAFAWISCEEDEVKKYETDEYCGTVFPINFYYYLFRGLDELNKKGCFSSVPKELPVYIMSGAEDPVGGYTKNVKRLYDKYSQVNIKDLELMFYPGGRHEMLNEVSREDVFNDILQWLGRQIVPHSH
jgi:alpha-beta hydrolase superfamily lysophospholipase